MIKITGITAEYNPLHNGHVWQLSEARSLSGCEAVAVAMSGDFVQRGEPAVLDKWTRCALALEAGADLVVEIPVQFCLGNAAQYAAASVSILEGIGCGRIAFGSECGEESIIGTVAEVLKSEEEALNSRISGLIKEGLSYPAARAEAYRESRRDAGDEQLDSEMAVLSEPNDILGLEYMLHMKAAKPLCIKRTGAAHDGRLKDDSLIQSAGAIRDILKYGNDTESIRDYVPDYTFEALKGEKPVFSEDCTAFLRYASELMDAERIEE